MQSQKTGSRNTANLAAVGAFLLVFAVLFVVTLMNAPIRSVAAVTESLGSYLSEVRETAMPFVLVVGVLAVVVGVVAAIVVRREWPNLRRRRALIAGYTFLAPYLLVTLVFTVGVVLFALYIAFTKYDIYTTPQWVGLDNFVKAVKQQDFQKSLHNVLWYAVIVTIFQTAIALALAVLLNTPMRFKQYFRTIFYAPSVTSSVVITLIFVWLYLKTGYINLAFDKVWGLFGLDWKAIDWLGNPKGLIQLVVEAFGGEISSDQWFLRGPSVAWCCLMVQNIFTTVPTFMIMFLAALQDINPSLYEAASIDGAGGWQRFWKITLPLLRPIVVMILVLSTIGTLQIFDQVYLATAGGPLDTTMTPVYLIFIEALGRQGPIQMGYASAIAFILAVLIFIFTFIQRRVIERGAEMY
ncbi:MAG: sugar ABC transporter permease [Anaerolineae bacterium]|jgi:multiple sugar transport system permease protein